MSANIIQQDPLENNNNKVLEVFCDGYFYDVTNFVKRHPGGNVIMFYTEKGEDATQAIQQFHNRSIHKVSLIMKSLPKRVPNETDVLPGKDLKAAEKHRSMTEDFAKLFLEIQKEKLFEPSYVHVFLRMFEIVMCWFVAYLCFRYEPLALHICGAALMGLGAGRAGWLMHEGGHRSLTGNPKADQLIQSVFVGLFTGLTAGWWNRGHNKHHAMPQRMHHDVDLNTMPFLAYNAKVVKNKKQGKSFFIQNQVWLFLTIDCLLGYIAWRIYICPRNALKRKEYFDFVLLLLHNVLVYLVAPSVPLALLGYWLGATYMFGNFALSHTHLPITEEHTHWLEYGLIHTANIKSSWSVDWWMGYLNFQIEHHLFPTLPQFRSHLVAERVKALAKKHDLPYQCFSYFECWMLTLQNFSNVAKQVREL